MSDDDSHKPTFTPKSMGFFSEWYVHVVWRSGYTENVNGFKSEAHARGWIEHESEKWIDEKRGPRR
jgi:hypothetical protein